jgi:hypothetical protein
VKAAAVEEEGEEREEDGPVKSGIIFQIIPLIHSGVNNDNDNDNNASAC